MDIFKGQELLAFCERFKTDDDCRSYLAELVFSDSCKSKKCEYTKCQIRKNHTRTCNKCSHTQSATNNTLFHKVKFGLRKAFFICFEMATTTKGRSAIHCCAVWNNGEYRWIIYAQSKRSNETERQ